MFTLPDSFCFYKFYYIFSFNFILCVLKMRTEVPGKGVRYFPSFTRLKIRILIDSLLDHLLGFSNIKVSSYPSSFVGWYWFSTIAFKKCIFLSLFILCYSCKGSSWSLLMIYFPVVCLLDILEIFHLGCIIYGKTLIFLSLHLRKKNTIKLVDYDMEWVFPSPYIIYSNTHIITTYAKNRLYTHHNTLIL